MYHRDISPPLQLFRTLLLGRTWNKQNRFQDMFTPRPYPKPAIPIGSANKAFENYYLGRDARREVTPNSVLFHAKEEKFQPSKNVLPPTPGKIYNWD